MFPKKNKYLVEKLYDHHKEKKRILNIDDEKIDVTIAAANIATAVCKRKRHKQRVPTKYKLWNGRMFAIRNGL